MTFQPKVVSLDESIPSSVEAEEALLGSMMINPALFPVCSQIVKAKDFFIVRNQIVWFAMEMLDRQRVDIDYLTLVDWLKSHKTKRGKPGIEELGGEKEAEIYLIGLATKMATSMNAEAYAQIVADKAVRRGIIAASDEIRKLAFDESTDLDTVIDKTQAHVIGFRTPGEKPTDVQTVMASHLKVLSDRKNSPPKPACITGWHSFDETVGSLYAGEVSEWCGKTGAGKTTLQQSLIANNCEAGKRVFYVGLESVQADQMNRFLAMISGVAIDRIKNSSYLPGEWEKVEEAAAKVSEWKLNVADINNLTPIRLRRILRETMMRHGVIDLVVVDGLYLMTPDPTWKQRADASNAFASFASIMNADDGVPAIADELQVHIAITNQYNKESRLRQDKRPTLDDVQGGGTAYFTVDMVLGFYRPYMNDKTAQKTAAEIHLLKTRDGQNTGETVHLVYDMDTRRYLSGAIFNLSEVPF